MKQQTTTLLLNIDPELKKRFKETCSVLGVTMTDVLISAIEKFNTEAVKNPNK